MDKHLSLAKSIEETFKTYFPNGYVHTHYSTNISDVIYVSIGLIGDIDWVTNNIRHNDPMLHSFCVFINSDGKYEARISHGSLKVKPEPGSYLAMDSVKTPWRKTMGDGVKVLKAFDRFFGRLVKIVDDEKDNIYDVEKIPAKFLEISD